MPDAKMKYRPLCGTGSGASGGSQPPARMQISRNRLLTLRADPRVRSIAASQHRTMRARRARVGMVSKISHMG